MKRSYLVLISVFLILSLLILWLSPKAGLWLVKKDDPVHADAIVMLMGSMSDRIREVVDLYNNNYSNKIIIVEPELSKEDKFKSTGPGEINYAKTAKYKIMSKGVPGDSIIILPGHARSTWMESLIVRSYLTEKSYIDTILLVSSSPHMRRASLIFDNAITKANQNVFVISIPSTYTHFNAKKWWKNKTDFFIVFSEYLKMLDFYVFDQWKL